MSTLLNKIRQSVRRERPTANAGDDTTSFGEVDKRAVQPCECFCAHYSAYYTLFNYSKSAKEAWACTWCSQPKMYQGKNLYPTLTPTLTLTL